jgi:hypothetical protein
MLHDDGDTLHPAPTSSFLSSAFQRPMRLRSCKGGGEQSTTRSGLCSPDLNNT